MARYIDVDVALKILEKSLLFSERELDIGEYRKGCIAAIKDDIGNIKHLPTADVVEVVRCKDCKHWGNITFGNICRRWTGLNVKNCTKPNDFCSYGERKDT